MHMIMIITVCAGILNPHPGCTIEEVEMLKEVSPQACLIKGQEYIAKQQARFDMNGYRVRAWGCRRGH